MSARDSPNGLGKNVWENGTQVRKMLEFRPLIMSE